MDVTIEEYAAFVSSLMEQAERDGFTYEVDMSNIRASGEPMKKGDQSDQTSR